VQGVIFCPYLLGANGLQKVESKFQRKTHVIGIPPRKAVGMTYMRLLWLWVGVPDVAMKHSEKSPGNPGSVSP